MVLHPWTASHRDVSPKHKERTGVRENLVRLSVGIEDAADIVSDLAQALAEAGMARTNAARILDSEGIAYDLIEYAVDRRTWRRNPWRQRSGCLPSRSSRR